MCGVILVIGKKEGCAHVAFVSLAPRIVAEGVMEAFPAHTIGMKVLESAEPVLCRHHLGIGGNREVFGDERMFVYLATQDQGEFDGAADELIPFQLRLATGDVEGGD